MNQKDDEKEMLLERVKQRALAAAEPGKVPYKEEHIEAARQRLLGLQERGLFEAHIDGDPVFAAAGHWFIGVPMSILAAMLVGLATDSAVALWLALLSGPVALFAWTSQKETQRNNEWKTSVHNMTPKTVAATYFRYVPHAENPNLWAELDYVKRWHLRNT